MSNAVAQIKTGVHVVVEQNNLFIEKKLGSGAFGVVHRVIDQRSNLIYALKDVACRNPSAIGRAISEVETLRLLNHDHIVKIIAADQFEDARGGFHTLILTEYCSGGNLNERLCQPSSDELNMKWLSQIASALSHLHSRQVVHRDLKPDNVLLTNPVSQDLKLGDFGLAREYVALKRTGTEDSWLAFYTDYYMKSGTGPIHWIAPEVFSRRYTEKADIFSLGVIFNAILQRDCAMLRGEEKRFGAFVKVSGQTKIGLGYAMAVVGPIAMEEFCRSSSCREASPFGDITMDTLQYNPRERPCADEVYDRIEEESTWIRLKWDEASAKKNRRSRKLRRSRNSCVLA